MAETRTDDLRVTRDVTREQFRAAALASGWDVRVIELYLADGASIGEAVGCGEFRLRIIDWPAQPKVSCRRSPRRKPRHMT